MVAPLLQHLWGQASRGEGGENSSRLDGQARTCRDHSSHPQTVEMPVLQSPWPLLLPAHPPVAHRLTLLTPAGKGRNGDRCLGAECMQGGCNAAQHARKGATALYNQLSSTPWLPSTAAAILRLTHIAQLDRLRLAGLVQRARQKDVEGLHVSVQHASGANGMRRHKDRRLGAAF